MLLSSKYLFIIFRRVFLLPIETVFCYYGGHKFRSIWDRSYLNTIEVSFFCHLPFLPFTLQILHTFPLYTLLAKRFLFSLPFHLQHKLFFCYYHFDFFFYRYYFLLFICHLYFLFFLSSYFPLPPRYFLFYFLSVSSDFCFNSVSSFTSNCSPSSFSFLSFDLSLIFPDSLLTLLLLLSFHFFFHSSFISFS